jgi:kynureninase
MSMPSEITTSSYAEVQDAADPLAPLRDEFVGAESDLVYFDGNSLGRPLRVTGDRLRNFVDQSWGGRLIRGWDEGWYDLPLTVGDEIGRVCLGAAPGQTAVGDSTTVLLYKMVRAAVQARPGRNEIVIDSDNFPTDRYIVQGIADELGLPVRWIEVERSGGVSLADVEAVVGAQTAVVLLSQVAYRSGHLADTPAITEVVRGAGALVIWDVCHSVGSVPIELDAWGVDVAVGCTYKYLNGGPGAPAFAYVAERHQAEMRQPIQGWMGHADPFQMGPSYEPSGGMRRFLSGTPAVIGMLAMQDMLELIDRAGMDAVRAKSVDLTTYALDLADVMLAEHGVAVATPRDPGQRGGHVTLNHPKMREVVGSLWQRDVIPDYRDPGGLRIGLSPLSTSYAEVLAGMTAIRDALSAA